MEFKIGTSLFIGGNSKYYLKSGVQGLAAPAIRVGEGLYAGRDGGFVSGHFYGTRKIVIPGFFIGDTCSEATQLRENLFNYLRIRYAMPIVIKDFDNNYFYTEGFVADVKSNVENAKAGDFQLTIVCPDPILYSMSDPSNISSIYKTETVTLSGTETVTINNAGSIGVQPKIYWSGEASEFEIANNTIGRSLGLDSLTPSGNVLLDFKKRIIMIDDACYNENRTLGSSWFELVPGNNELELSLDSESPTSITIEYPVNAKVGI